MSCHCCNLSIGDVVTLTSAICDLCGYDGFENDIVSYLGKFGTMHVFRAHNSWCPSCNHKIRKTHILCKNDDGLYVTDDFESIDESFAWINAIGRRK